jgi:hypothetical protein
MQSCLRFRSIRPLLTGGLMTVISLVLEPSALAQDRITIQQATLEPGDVINFTGGGATLGGIRKYGHTGLYLGIDPVTKKPAFLDFTTDSTKGGTLLHKSNKAFNSKILGLEEFLSDNISHPSFDVFRLKDRSTLDQKALIRTAKVIASEEIFCVGGEVCSSAAARVLSAGTGVEVDVFSPDGFANSPQFQRHPDLQNRSIDVAKALVEARSAAADANRPTKDLIAEQSVSPPPHVIRRYECPTPTNERTVSEDFTFDFSTHRVIETVHWEHRSGAFEFPFEESGELLIVREGCAWSNKPSGCASINRTTSRLMIRAWGPLGGEDPPRGVYEQPPYIVEYSCRATQ